MAVFLDESFVNKSEVAGRMSTESSDKQCTILNFLGKYSELPCDSQLYFICQRDVC